MKPFSPAARARHEKDLLEVTAIPTATGCEDRVVAWVERWAKRRGVTVERDVWGNLMLRRPGVRRTPNPLVLAAHLDHPAFVVTGVEGGTIEAEFRGGVQDAYFEGTKVRLWRAGSRQGPGVPGRVTELRPADPAVPGQLQDRDADVCAGAQGGARGLCDVGPGRVGGEGARDGGPAARAGVRQPGGAGGGAGGLWRSC